MRIERADEQTGNLNGERTHRAFTAPSVTPLDLTLSPRIYLAWWAIEV